MWPRERHSSAQMRTKAEYVHTDTYHFYHCSKLSCFLPSPSLSLHHCNIFQVKNSNVLQIATVHYQISVRNKNHSHYTDMETEAQTYQVIWIASGLPGEITGHIMISTADNPVVTITSYHWLSRRLTWRQKRKKSYFRGLLSMMLYSRLVSLCSPSCSLCACPTWWDDSCTAAFPRSSWMTQPVPGNWPAMAYLQFLH